MFSWTLIFPGFVQTQTTQAPKIYIVKILYYMYVYVPSKKIHFYINKMFVNDVFTYPHIVYIFYNIIHRIHKVSYRWLWILFGFHRKYKWISAQTYRAQMSFGPHSISFCIIESFSSTSMLSHYKYFSFIIENLGLDR